MNGNYGFGPPGQPQQNGQAPWQPPQAPPAFSPPAQPQAPQYQAPQYPPPQAQPQYPPPQQAPQYPPPQQAPQYPPPQQAQPAYPPQYPPQQQAPMYPPPQGYPAPQGHPGYPPPQSFGQQPQLPGTNLFPGLADAEVSERGAYMKPGHYLVRVKKAIYKTVRKGYDAFILEFVVEQSNYQSALQTAVQAYNGQQYNLVELNKLLPNQVGETASWFQSLADKAIGWGSVKGFAAQILGADPKDPTFRRDVEGFLSSCITQGAINGKLLPLEVVTIKKKDGGDFSRHNFGRIVPEQAPAPAPVGSGG